MQPKAFLSVSKDRNTMFAVTVNRIRKIIPFKNILVSANRLHLELIKKDFPGMAGKNIMLEPVSRNTAPAIGTAAFFLQRRFKDAVMVVLPADQYIIDEKKYLSAIKKGISFASAEAGLVVLGLKPTYSSTGFGYVRIKTQDTRHKAQGVYKVARFTEKPDLKTAKRFMRDGRYLWNAGAFVFRASVLLDAVRIHAPDIFSILTKMRNSRGTERLYKKFQNISIDYAVMERAGNIYCVKGSYRWRDIGSFGVLKEVLQKESRGFIEKNGKVVKIL